MRRPAGIGAVALLGLLVIVELAAPRWVASGIERDVHAETAGRVGVDARVAGPPVLLPVVATGSMGWIEFDVVELVGRDLLPLEVTIRLEGITVDRASILAGDARVDAVDRAELAVHLDLGADLPPLLRPFADAAVDGGLTALLESGLGPLAPRGDGGGFSLGDDLDLDVAGGVEGCQVDVTDLVVDVECALNEVPPVLLRALQ